MLVMVSILLIVMVFILLVLVVVGFSREHPVGFDFYNYRLLCANHKWVRESMEKTSEETPALEKQM